jgi:hypothetical protein
MESNTSTKQTESENRIFLNGKQLAEVLGVSAPTITEAVKNGWNCGGYPVGEWAIESKNGRVKGYEVPEFLVSGDQKEKKRSNPSPESTNTALIAANSDKLSPDQASNSHTNHYSLLPEGEDYVRPIGMVTLSSVIKKALESDTPQSKAIITGGLTGIGALIGNVTTDDSVGTVIGALAGFGISYFSYHYFSASNQSPTEINIQANKYDHKLLKKYGNQSGYLLN